MTPGMVNGVRCVWPQPRRVESVEHVEEAPAPEPKSRAKVKPGEPCLHGHDYDRTPSGKCRACNREWGRRWRKEHREEVNAARRAERAARKAA